MNKQITGVDNFQLAFNAIVRNFCNHPSKELFGMIKRTYLAYLPYMDYRTAGVAMRDFLDLLGYGTGILYWDKVQEGSEMYELLTPLVDSLAYCMQDRAKQDRYLEVSLASDLRDTPFGNGKIEKDASMPYDFPPSISVDKPFPMSGTKEDFEHLAFEFVRYAKGRHTYMPSCATEFVEKNMGLLSDDMLTKINAFLDEGSDTEKTPVWYCDDDMRGLSAKVLAELQKREKAAKQKTRKGG